MDEYPFLLGDKYYYDIFLILLRILLISTP